MKQANLLAKNIHCRRGDRLLIRALDLQLEAGDALHLVGPNGIGKTSLLRILAGLLPVSKNWSDPDGTLPAASVEIHGSTGFLDGNLSLDEHLTLGKALEFWANLDDTTPDEALAQYKRLGLEPLLDVPVRYLSTGQRKRAALAQLLGQNADNWLLDEPLNGLDDDGVVLVEELIAEKRSSGGIVIVASHQQIAMTGAQTLDLRAQLRGEPR